MGLHIWLYALVIFNHHAKQLGNILYSISHTETSLIGSRNNKYNSVQEIFKLKNPMGDLTTI